MSSGEEIVPLVDSESNDTASGHRYGTRKRGIRSAVAAAASSGDDSDSSTDDTGRKRKQTKKAGGKAPPQVSKRQRKGKASAKAALKNDDTDSFSSGDESETGGPATIAPKDKVTTKKSKAAPSKPKAVRKPGVVRPFLSDFGDAGAPLTLYLHG